MCRARLARQESLGEGAEPAVTEREGCPGRLAPRVTVALMAWRGCQGRKATGVTLAHPARRDLQGKTEKGATMEKLGPEGCLGSPGREVCWGRRAPQVPLDLPV